MKRRFFFSVSILLFSLTSFAQIIVPPLNDDELKLVKKADMLYAWFPDKINGYPGSEYAKVLESEWKGQPVKIVDSLGYEQVQAGQLFVRHLYFSPEFVNESQQKGDYSKENQYTLDLSFIYKGNQRPIGQIVVDNTTSDEGGGNVTPTLFRYYLKTIMNYIDSGEVVALSGVEGVAALEGGVYTDTSLLSLDTYPLYVPDYTMSYYDIIQVKGDSPKEKADELFDGEHYKYKVVTQQQLDSLVEKHAPGYFFQFFEYGTGSYCAIFNIRDGVLALQMGISGGLSPKISKTLDNERRYVEAHLPDEKEEKKK